MTRSYTEESGLRTHFAEDSVDRFLGELKCTTVRDALGDTALQLEQLVEHAFVPTVSETGIITIPDSLRHQSSIPFVAVGAQETLWRDTTFASFMPRQYMAELASQPLLDDAAERVRQGAPEHSFKVEAPGDSVSPLRLHYVLHHGPQQLYFNLRPLVVIRYEGTHQTPIRGAEMAGALMQTLNIVKNPCVPTTTLGDFLEITGLWEQSGVEVAKTFVLGLNY
jgi:hypothetical protein